MSHMALLSDLAAHLLKPILEGKADFARPECRVWRENCRTLTTRCARWAMFHKARGWISSNILPACSWVRSWCHYVEDSLPSIGGSVLSGSTYPSGRALSPRGRIRFVGSTLGGQDQTAPGTGGRGEHRRCGCISGCSHCRSGASRRVYDPAGWHTSALPMKPKGRQSNLTGTHSWGSIIYWQVRALRKRRYAVASFVTQPRSNLRFAGPMMRQDSGLWGAVRWSNETARSDRGIGFGVTRDASFGGGEANKHLA